ncbi:MAG: glycogen synthase GlgA [Myxococcota bacterium]
MPRLRILFVVSECVPFVKTGGLGDVAGALPPALTARGHDVRVVMPRYRATKSFPSRRRDVSVGVPLGGGGTRWCGLVEATLPGATPVYFLEHDVLFDRDGVYGDAHGSFGDNLLRYAVLSRGAFAVADAVAFRPDVVHINDWPTGLVPLYARHLGRPVATVMSIHNLGYQGWFSFDDVGVAGVSPGEARARGYEHGGALNLLQGGILNATMVSTVSPTYAAEIATDEGGMGLQGAIRARGADVIGVLNGIDDTVWDPRRDPHLPARYDVDDLAGKAVCKAALQAELGLPVRADVPLIGVVSRFAHQKGIDVLAAALESLLTLDLQLAVLGKGEPWAEALFRHLGERSDKVGAHIAVDERLAHRIEAGADLFLMPSRYEPCGLNQMYSQRYGTLPVVRAVGGLVDTVAHDRTGFVFADLTVDGLVGAVRHALTTMRERPEHFAAMRRAAMEKSMGWDRSAAHYEALYRLAIARTRRR